MKKFTRVMTFIVVICLTVSLFGGCGKDNEETASTASGSVELSAADINFVDADGESTFRIIRPEECSDIISKSAPLVFGQIKKAYSVSAKNTSDSEPGDGFAEILIGETNREASAKAKELLLSEGTKRRDEYIICYIGDDIAIVGMTDEATVEGVNYFVNNYITGSVITGGLNYLYSDPSKYVSVELFGKTDLGDIKVVRPIYNVAYITQEEIYNLIDTVGEKTGYNIELVHDNTASDTGVRDNASGVLTPTTPAEYEIIVGNCTRSGVSTITDYNSYEIRIESNKIYLNGGSPYATALAVTEFTNMIASGGAITSAKSVADGDYEAVVAGYNKDEYYYPTWKEDFDSSSIDSLKYWTCRWDQKSGYADDGKDTYRGSSKLKNNYLQDGKCYIVAAQDHANYYGGMLDTQLKFEFLYGVLELSTLHPKGNGFWTSLWTVSDDSGMGPEADPQRVYKSETDIEECYGEGTWVYGNTFAWPTSYGKASGILNIPEGSDGAVHVNNVKYCDDDRGFYMDYHTYGFVWIDSTHVLFTCDGYVYADQQLREGAEQMAYSQPQFLKLSMACGTAHHGEMTQDKENWTKYNKFITEYVHIYQKTGGKLYFGDNHDNWTTKTR